jgi:hypothetical protein
MTLRKLIKLSKTKMVGYDFARYDPVGEIYERHGGLRRALKDYALIRDRSKFYGDVAHAMIFVEYKRKRKRQDKHNPEWHHPIRLRITDGMLKKELHYHFLEHLLSIYLVDEMQKFNFHEWMSASDADINYEHLNEIWEERQPWFVHQGGG